VACGTVPAAPNAAPSGAPPQAPAAEPVAPAPAQPLPPARPRTMAPATLQVPAPFRQGAFSQDRQLQIVEGFAISVYARVAGARSMTVAPWGELLVSQPNQGRITGVRDGDGDGAAETQRAVLSNLQCPYGMAFRDDYLYVAQTTKVERFRYDANHAFGPAEPVVGNLPQSGCGAHQFRPLTFDWSGNFYVAFGSSCNVCVEPDTRRGTVWQYTLGGDAREYARGLRNVVDLTINPSTGELWGATNERDNLGDDIPPDPVSSIGGDANYGWPFCFWNNGSWAVDPRVPARNPGCSGLTVYNGIQAHSAPLGLTFSTQSGFPIELAGSIYVASHGSWNRSSGVGYKVQRIPIADGVPQPAQDFVSGWLTGTRGPQDAWGRPVDIQDGPDGALYVSDDLAGAIYRVYYVG
jgi:glucose/arabinose dehydrogenase